MEIGWTWLMRHPKTRFRYPVERSKMHTYYGDIIDRIPIEPLWWDEHAVPRYCEFSPDKIANIYAREAVLLLISCQFGPIHHFKVALSRCQNEVDLATEIRNKTIHYGDPPIGKGCGDGDANSIPIQVLQYWHRNDPQYVGDKVDKDGRITKNAVIDYEAWRKWSRDETLEIDVLGGLKPGSPRLSRRTPP